MCSCIFMEVRGIHSFRITPPRSSWRIHSRAITGKSSSPQPAVTHPFDTHPFDKGTPGVFRLCVLVEAFDFVCLQKLYAFGLGHNPAKILEASFYLYEAEAQGKSRGPSCQWEGRWVLTFWKEGVLWGTPRSTSWGEGSWPSSWPRTQQAFSCHVRQMDSENAVPVPAVRKC